MSDEAAVARIKGASEKVERLEAELEIARDAYRQTILDAYTGGCRQ